MASKEGLQLDSAGGNRFDMAKLSAVDHDDHQLNAALSV